MLLWLVMEPVGRPVAHQRSSPLAEAPLNTSSDAEDEESRRVSVCACGNLRRSTAWLQRMAEVSAGSCVASDKSEKQHINQQEHDGDTG